ncbi:MAG: 4Fe-4S binding protein [Spirochaetaceae bacterium]|nr:4Fe-4S binding protein [Spirochaetaceae bacterium]
MKNVIEVIFDRCLGCHTCELECALAHSESETFVQAIQSKERLYPRIILETDGTQTIPMHCRHCSDAPCITVCPTTAMSRNSLDEPVILNKEKCIGCNSCVIVCPFGIIKTVPVENFLSKCDLCAERLENGEIPACAASCPTKAIRFTNIADLTTDRRKEVLEKFKVSMAVSDELKE